MLLLHNAQIYTLDPERPQASAILIDRRHIVDIGDKHTLLSEAHGNVVSEDLDNRTVIPGLTDAHIHLEQYALSLDKVDCETATKVECLQNVSKRADRLHDDAWILGHGWNQNDWIDGFGTAADLDKISGNHPVYLTAKSLHAGWANSMALRMANISSVTADPPGGRIGRDQHGQPTGILFESAMDLITSVIPNAGVDLVVKAINNAQNSLWKVGITSVHDFDRSRCFQALQILNQRGDLRLRVIKSLPLEDLPHAVALGLRSGYGDDYLRIGSIKAFADGALGPRTAAMIQSYEGEPNNRGMLLLDREELSEHGRLAVENGLSLAVHAIGDRANHEVLGAFAQIRDFENEVGIHPLRHRIEHVQLLHHQDVNRLGELGIVASMQPIHATSDMPMADRYWGDRAGLAYGWRSQISSGAILAFGSDAPVESPNPFWGMHAAVTRQRVDGSPGSDGWIPDQKIGLLDALKAYTTGAAYAAGMETRVGKLARGYLADLIVLDENLFNCEPNKIRDIRPVSTMVSGIWVYKI